MNASTHASGWSTISLAGHPCGLHLPERATPGMAVVLLDDPPIASVGRSDAVLGQSRAMRERLVAAGMPVIVPPGGEGWWLERVVRSFDPAVAPAAMVVGPVLDEAGRRFAVRPPMLALVGCGAGGQGALGLAYRRPDLFPVVAAVGPAIDFHLAMRDGLEGSEVLWEVFEDVERARQETAILHVHPLNWPRHQFFAADADDPVWYDGACRLHGKLAALGIPHEWMLDPVGPGRSFAIDAADAAVAFVVDRLGRESRRIP